MPLAGPRTVHRYSMEFMLTNLFGSTRRDEERNV